MALEQTLLEIVGEGHVITDPAVRAGFERDWTGRFGGESLAVVRPGSTTEVAEILRACSGAGVGVVPQGGNTGLVGGGVPRGSEVVLSTSRLDEVGALDISSGQIRAGAGVTLSQLQAAAASHGLDAGLDFGSRDAATLGGIAACNAGGIRALRHGTARDRIAGIEAVLSDGTTLTFETGLAKDNAGYDLPSLLIGSEGTLTVITAVLWKTVRAAPARAASMIAVGSIDEALAVLDALRTQAASSVESCDFLDHASLEASLAHLGRSDSPVQRAPYYVLAECAAPDPATELAEALERAGVADRAVLATDSATRRSLWEIREAVPEAISTRGVAHKIDVGIPSARLATFLQLLPARLAELRVEQQLFTFGHLGDGNVHVAIVGTPPDDPRVDDLTLGLALELGGTISAEHGVGTAKAAWLERCRGRSEVTAMRAIKNALDPAGVMNPGKVLS